MTRYELLLEKKQEEDSYVFVTKSGKVYRIYFVSDYSLFENPFDDSGDEHPLTKLTRQVGFLVVDSAENTLIKETKFDPLVKNTIVFAIKNHLSENPEHILIFVCDPKNNGGRGRSTLFRRWARELPDDSVDVISREVRQKETILHTGLIIRTSNHLYREVISAYETRIKELQAKFE